MIGVLVREPDLRRFNDRPTESHITLSVSLPEDPSGDRASFFNFISFGDLAEACQSFAKGTTLLVEGHVETRLLDDARGHSTRHWWVICHAIQEVRSDGTVGDRHATTAQQALESSQGFFVD